MPALAGLSDFLTSPAGVLLGPRAQADGAGPGVWRAAKQSCLGRQPTRKTSTTSTGPSVVASALTAADGFLTICDVLTQESDTNTVTGAAELLQWVCSWA